MRLAIRRWLPLLALAAMGPMLLATARPAHAKTVDLTGQSSFVYETWSLPNPPVDPNRCVAYTFVELPDVAGAASYDVTISRASNGQIQHWGGTPPLDGDEYRVGSGQQTNVFRAPAGKHRTGPMSAYSVGSGCGDALAGVTGAWNLVSVTAEVAKGRFDLSGTVTGCPDDQPLCSSPGPLQGATVTATSAAGSTSGVTDATGRYKLTLDEDAYTVSAALGDRRFDPPSRVVDLRSNTDGIDFAASQRFRVSGTITACKPDDRCEAPVPVADVVVQAGGTSAEQAVTDSLGRYTLQLLKGTYTLTPALKDAIFEPATRKAVVNKDLDGQDFRTCTEDGVQFTRCSSLVVTVTPKPAKLVLKQTAKGTEPQDVTFTIAVRNRSKKPIYNVTLDPQLVIGYVGGAHTDRLPLRLRNESSRAALKLIKLGTLKPGVTRGDVLHYVAYGDGRLDVRAVVTYSLQPRSRSLDAGGTTVVDIRTKALYLSMVEGKKVRSPNSGKLIQAGTAFSVRVRIENRSWVKRMVVVPIVYPGGNAHGGHWQPTGKPIQITAFTDAGIEPPALPPELELAPRQKVEYDVVFFTLAGNAARRSDVPGEDGRRSGGGTRATLLVGRPLAFVEDPNDTEGWRPATESEVLIDPDRRKLQYSLDDRAPDVAPFSPLLATVNFSVGVVQGGFIWAGAALHGAGWLLTDLPAQMVGGLLEVPTQIRKYTQYQAELWHAVRNDEATKNDFGAQVTSVVKSHFSKLLEIDTKFMAGVDQAVYDHYEVMHREWYAGDWAKASSEFGIDFSQRTLDVGSAIVPIVGPAVLARFPRAATALETFKTAAQAQAETALATLRIRPTSAMVGKVVEAERMAWGTELTPALAEQLLGMSEDQYRWTSNWIKGRDLLLTVRSRAAESLRFRTAVYKPEQFKVGTVDWIDVEYLGYQFDDIGTLVLKSPPTRADTRTIQGILRKEGKRAGDKVYDAVMKKIQQRQFEWGTNQDQYVKSLKAWAEKGEVDFQFNWRDNLIDPNAAPPEPSALAGIKLQRRYRTDPITGREVEEYAVWVQPDQVGKYERVVGDTDMPSLTTAAGFGLDDATHISALNDLRASPYKIRHPDTGSWSRNGEFNFPAKQKYMSAGIQAQWGPDGKLRLVRFDAKASKLLAPDNYWVAHEGEPVY